MPSNSTFDYTRYCGANNCPADILPSSSTTPSRESVYILVGILVTICVIGIINTICFMDNIPMITDKKENVKKMSIRMILNILLTSGLRTHCLHKFFFSFFLLKFKNLPMKSRAYANCLHALMCSCYCR
jgi:hypothetical protein